MPTKIAEMTRAGMTIYQGGYEAYARGDRPILTPEPLPEPVKAPPEKGEGAETYYRSKKQRAEDVRRKKRAAELEREIAGDEAEIERLTAYMSGEEAASDYESSPRLPTASRSSPRDWAPNTRSGTRCPNRKILHRSGGNPRPDGL